MTNVLTSTSGERTPIELTPNISGWLIANTAAVYPTRSGANQLCVASSNNPRQYPSSNHGFTIPKMSHGMKISTESSSFQWRIKSGRGNSPMIRARTNQPFDPLALANRALQPRVPSNVYDIHPSDDQNTNADTTHAHGPTMYPATWAVICPIPMTKTGERMMANRSRWVSFPVAMPRSPCSSASSSSTLMRVLHYQVHKNIKLRNTFPKP
jgi:hypothetical protein